MKITCYGSRGSLPSPSRKDFSTVEFGGNTNCFYIEAGPFNILLGCGSGVSILGDDLMKRWVKADHPSQHFIVLLTHYHWDHIQGLPFCTPLYLDCNTFHFHGMHPSGYGGQDRRNLDHPRTVVEMMLAHQQSNPYFPVAHESLPASKKYHSHNRQFSETFYYHNGYAGLSFHDRHPQAVGGRAPANSVLTVTTVPLQHPNGCLGWVIKYEGKKVAFCYDMEPLRFPNQKVSKLGHNADLMVLDGAYTEQQVQGMQQGFGHGSPESCIEQAKDAEALYCLVHHHDPKHDDDKLREMEANAQDYASGALYKGRIEFAREGNVYEV